MLPTFSTLTPDTIFANNKHLTTFLPSLITHLPPHTTRRHSNFMTSSSERVIVNESHSESVLRLTADPALLSDLSMTLVSNSPAVKLSVRRTPSQIAVIYDCKRRGSGLVNGMISRRSMAGVGPMLVLSWVKVCSGGPVQGFDVKYGIKEIVKDGRTEVSILEGT